MIGLPHMIAASALCCALFGVLGYRAGAEDAEAACNEEKLAAVRHAIEQERRIMAEDAEILAATRERVSEPQTKYRVVIKRIRESDPTACDGVGLLPGVVGMLDAVRGHGELPAATGGPAATP